MAVRVRRNGPVAAINDIVPKDSARSVHIHRLGQGEFGIVLDEPVGVTWGEIDVRDDGIERIIGIDCAVCTTCDQLIVADLVAWIGTIRDNGLSGNLNAGDFGLRTTGTRYQDRNARRCQRAPAQMR